MKRLLRHALPALTLLAAACGMTATSGYTQSAEEAQRHRAALALLTVENATSRHLRIAFRPAVGPGGEVVLGTVAAESTATMAPLPAGEPLALAAIADDSSRYTLPPRSFDLDQHWTWRIPPDAAFTYPSGRLP